jgi:hypothetical protein
LNWARVFSHEKCFFHSEEELGIRILRKILQWNSCKALKVQRPGMLEKGKGVEKKDIGAGKVFST